MEVNLLLAFTAGLVSFFAPCVTVLVPGFLSHIAGTSLNEVTQDNSKRWQIFWHSLAFVLGFTAVFVSLGAALGFLSSLVLDYQIWISRIGGLLIIYFGLVSLKLLPSPFNFGVTVNSAGLSSLKMLGSVLVGAAFAVGWSSCVGPVLAAILVLAGSSASVISGTSLLLAYSLGLMIPFLAVALFTVRSANFLSAHPKLINTVSIIGGVILILLGILVFTDQFRVLVGSLYSLSPFTI